MGKIILTAGQIAQYPTLNETPDDNTGEDFHTVTTNVVFYLNKGFTQDQLKGVKNAS